MNSTAALVLFGLEQLLKHAPSLFFGIRAVMNKKIVRIEDVRALREQIESETYEVLITHSKLKKK